MERYYVLSKEISGTSRHDRRMTVSPCVERGGFSIIDPVQYVATRLFQFMEDYVDPGYTRRWVLGKLREGGLFSLVVNNPGVGLRVERVILKSKPDEGLYLADIRGNVVLQQRYEVSRIDDRRLAYLACEYLVHPFDDVPLVRRTYVPLFTQLANANRYVQSESRNYSCKYGDADSGWKVVPVDADEVQRSEWFQANQKAAMDIKQYHLEREDFRYIGDLDELARKIQEAAYDDLIDSEKDSINYDIYMAIRDYLPPSVREDLDGALDEFADDGSGDIEGVADQAIRAAFGYVASQEAFDALTEILAPWRYRVEGANDYVYNAHPDAGWLLASKDGDLRWFEDVAFANEWPGNEGNPWFGKFIPNACEPLPFVVAFDTRDIADRIPTASEMDMLKQKYLETVRAERAAHPEMVFEDCEDDMGEMLPCCVGNWYPDGLDKEIPKYKDIFFRVDYGNHKFTEDECRRLLSGEEIEFDGFLTKSKLTVTVRGKLLDRTGPFSEYIDVQFVRTDVHNNVRRDHARKLGLSIDEGLPDDPTSSNAGI